MTKKLLTTVALVAVLALPLAGLVRGQEHEHEQEGEISAKGEILDMACFLSHGSKGEEHASCASRCVKGGQPMGFLTEEGTVYLLFASHTDGSPFEEAKSFAGKKAEVKGSVSSKDGFKAIEVHSVKPL